MLLTAGLVISMELINTAIEDLANMITREKHPTIGKIKDIAAAAVLFSAIIAVITGLIIFTKYIF
jgi:diacylglycerol kinase